MAPAVHHIALRTGDLARLERFYTALFALEVGRRAPGSVWLALGHGAVLMLEAAGPDEPAVPTGSMEFFSLAIDHDALADFERRAGEMGVAVEHRTARTLYLRDPDGRRVGVSSHPLLG